MNKKPTVTVVGHQTLYVYYKIPVEQRSYYLSAIKLLQQEISLRYPEVVVQRQKRPDADRNNHETWMEIYVGMTPVQIEPLLADLLLLAKLHELPQERRNEIFVNL